uniref:Histone deacetylase domain-containing protein n=1 Tax=Timema cristinae TaxID=61476 RepID=A0A7R9GXJ7_TIMCR|nr:unnamed protein product [Timema cristinae]
MKFVRSMLAVTRRNKVRNEVCEEHVSCHEEEQAAPSVTYRWLKSESRRTRPSKRPLGAKYRYVPADLYRQVTRTSRPSDETSAESRRKEQVMRDWTVMLAAVPSARSKSYFDSLPIDCTREEIGKASCSLSCEKTHTNELLTESSQTTLQRLTGLPIVHHHGYVCELPHNHRFPMPKFHKVLEFLIKDNVISREKQVIHPKQVSRKLACHAHTEEYVDKFFNGKTTVEEQRVTGFAWTLGLASRVSYVVYTGGTVLASQLSMSRGLATSTAGGTHHAFPDRGSGYCLINDLAVAAIHLSDTTDITRVLIGDGTAVIFKDTEHVFTFSMHCEQNFPFRKQKSDLDIGVDKGTGDEQFLRILTVSFIMCLNHKLGYMLSRLYLKLEYLPYLLDVFRPELIIYDAGVDPHKDDEDYYVMDEAIRRGIPCSVVIGGGYSQNINVLAKRHTIMHRAATKIWSQRQL